MAATIPPSSSSSLLRSPPPASNRPQPGRHLVALPLVPLPLLPLPALESFFFAALGSAPSLPHLRQAHALLLRLGLHHSNFLVSKLIRRSSSSSPSFPTSYPLRIFLSVPDPNPFLFTSLIRCCCCSSSSSLLPSLRLFSLMRRRRLPPLPFTFSALLKSAAAARSLPAGSLLHSLALSLGGFPSHLSVANSLLSMYVACSDLPSARRLFDEMPLRDPVSWTSLVVAYARGGDMHSAEALFASSPAKDVVAWTAVVTGYAQNAMPREALDAFARMRDAGVALDEVALVGAVSACAQLGAVGRARWVRGIADAHGFGTGVVVGSALVDMYAKCGLIDDARRVFDEMPERNVYTYSSLIVGLASHGRACEAIALFREMVETANVAPNRVTFVGVLAACSHAGMVEEGRFFFARMKDEYGVPQSADHYACMVDLLGRAGLVEEALELVKSMPVKPHGGVWGALLGACRIHNRPEIAKIAGDHLFRLEPKGIGNYILLSNTYASAGMWDEVSKVRKLMRGRGLKKNPAASWVEGKDGSIHEFFAGDGSHPRSREIKEVLEELMGRLRLIGYAPILSSVVYHVGDDEKARILEGHSEKLALGFALLTMGAGGAIRIAKNLRICEDCHLVMSLASKAEKVEIVVRDNTRFHHFRNGECTCGGFW